MTHQIYRQALKIREVENKFLELFSQGKLNGTVHTSVGQEFSALAFAGQITSDDFIFSNHRCHGHYLAYTQDTRGLLAELMGKKSGTCGGVGSSQHLCKGNFFSNGIQGGIVPVAAGFALANKLRQNGNIGIVFIGDGTLGEGVLYETFNIISKWEIPLMIVCENNSYAQSTHQSINLAGDILKRAEAFGVKTFHSNTWAAEQIMQNGKDSIDFVRAEQKPAFHLVDTYRLNAHSKGDDDRDKSEIADYAKKDPINVFAETETEIYKKFLKEINIELENYVSEIEKHHELTLSEYYTKIKEQENVEWSELEELNIRQVQLINEFFKEKMASSEKTVFIGEDVLSPYGGAFKVAKDLSTMFSDRVFSTPISEAAITGIGNGLALAGMKPYVEIMFGDFTTLALDQIINHASKFYHMYNKQVTCPVVIRTPMGGGRGYGPTHSQTLDKFLIGIDNVKTIALNIFVNPKTILEAVQLEEHPVVVIENKTDYGKKLNQRNLKNYKFLKSNHAYPIVRISPLKSEPTVTIVSYGGVSGLVANQLLDIFSETDLKPELLILSKINPIDFQPIMQSVQKTKKLIVIEEGSITGGIGSEIVSFVSEHSNEYVFCKRIGALSVPIPSVKELESNVLPSEKSIIQHIKTSINQ